ncbi:sugar ABC transporter substrate-binding protein [Desulfofundulus thermobenzoicus]|nr:sugar ABC transporter substrate-binding protein [Desulfofundulus thermobenzoicus]
MKSRWVFFFFIFLGLGLILAGCASPQGNQQTGKDTSQKQLTFGMIIKEPSAPYIQAFINGAQEKAKELGVKVDIKDGQADSLKIMEIMDNYIQQKVDGFIMAGAVDLKAIVPGIKKLNEAGIPVIALDTSPEGGKVDLFISFDIQESSKRAAEAFIQGIKDRHGGKVPPGVVLEITGSLEDMFTQACSKGFHSVVDQYPQLKVAQGEGKWNNVDSNQKTTDLLTRYGKQVMGIYVHTPDIMGPGVVNAIESAGLNPKDYGICGICIGPEGLELLKQGKLLAAVEQPALDSAELAVQYLYDIKNGKPIPKIGETVVKEGAIWSPAKVVKNPWADEGAFMVLQGPLVPNEVKTDDPRLWENKLSNLWKK